RLEITVASASTRPATKSWSRTSASAAEEDKPAKDSMVGPASVVVAPHDGDPEAVVQSMPTKKERSASALLPNKKECEYRNEKWVSDNRRPIYLGFGCKQWLSASWSCRLTQRKDFAYEKFRWQPEACEMPEFEASQILRRMQDKTIAYVDDSLGRQMFQSMMCMVTDGKERLDVEIVGAEYGCPLNPSDRAASYATHLDRPPAFLKSNLHRLLVLALDTDHHWNRGKLRANRWEMYLSRAPNSDSNTVVIWKAKNFTVHNVVRWVDAQLPHHPKLKAFY
ncbi:hypothetical protein ACJX0J_041657, partial [Zea mays]